MSQQDALRGADIAEPDAVFDAEGASQRNALREAQLAACSTEAIHVPGAIQPHGVLLTLAEPSLAILQYSENVTALLSGAEPLRVERGTRLGDAIDPALHLAVTRAVAQRDLQRPVPLGAFRINDRDCDAVLHRHASTLILELERAEQTPGEGFAAIHSVVSAFTRDSRQPASITRLCEVVANEMRRITGFGRTLVYRFDEDGHGLVLAQSAADGYESYLGHRFPASDIPLQARALYQRNPIRLIPDADYQPVPLVPPLHPDTGQPVDLTFASLRSVSPVHLEYMRNMGTRASMSVSILVRDRLWGLISCHDRDARYLPYALRLAAEHLGQLLSLQVESLESVTDAQAGVQLRRLLVSLVTATAESGGAVESLADSPDDLLQLAAASGAAVVAGGRLRLVGDTPPSDAVLALAEWLALQGHEVLATDWLGERYEPAREYADKASGVLAISLSQLHRHFVIWFRPGVTRTVHWAGNPDKPMVADTGGTDADPEAGGTARLHPRRSFATWSEELRGRSVPWRSIEVSVASELRHALLNIVLRRAEEVAALAGELGRMNQELEAFSYSVSHDLRAPLRHITGFADLVRDYEGTVLSERGHRYLQNIKESASFAGRLVDDLLSFSQMGRTVLRPARVDLQGLVRDIVRNKGMDPAHSSIRWDIGALPVVQGDPVFMQVVMQNLLDNAVKYSGTRAEPRISVHGTDTGTHDVVQVSDNGVGFDMRYVGKLFGVFQRLHAVEEFSGTGIGLASVRRAVERHGGTVHAHGELGVGATFTFSLPKPLPSVDHSSPTQA